MQVFFTNFFCLLEASVGKPAIIKSLSLHAPPIKQQRQQNAPPVPVSNVCNFPSIMEIVVGILKFVLIDKIFKGKIYFLSLSLWSFATIEQFS